MRTILLAVTVMLGSTGIAAADASKPSTAAATAVKAAKSQKAAVLEGAQVEANAAATEPTRPARLVVKPYRRGVHLDKLELAKRERIRQLFRDAQRRHGQPDNVVIDGLMPPLPGVLIVPAPHPDTRPYPFGMLLVEPPRATHHIVFVKRAPCQPRCSQELRRCGFIATPQDHSVPLWPWIAAAALGGAALIVVARERRRLLLEPLP